MSNLLKDMSNLNSGDLDQINFVMDMTLTKKSYPRTTREWHEIALFDKEKLHALFVDYYANHYSFNESVTRDTYQKLYGERPHVKEDKERDWKKTLRSTTPFSDEPSRFLHTARVKRT